SRRNIWPGVHNAAFCGRTPSQRRSRGSLSCWKGLKPWLHLLDTLHNQVGRQVDHERDAEEQDADEKQYLVMVRAFAGFTQLSRDRGGKRANRVEDAVRNAHA